MSTQPPFADKIALVTGSGRGIGRAIALQFAHKGADVVVHFFRRRQPAEETAAEIRALGRRALVVKAHLGDLDDLSQLFDAIRNTWGGLDYFIHNAASGYNRPVLQQKPRGWNWTMDVNARALLFGAQQAVPLMQTRGGGAIVALSSLGAQRVLQDYVLVGASKAALEALVRYLGVELAPLQITVNGVAPGVVATEALLSFESFREGGAALLETITGQTPAGRLCTPEDVAGVVCFLCTPAARMLCGQILTLDGGHSLKWRT